MGQARDTGSQDAMVGGKREGARSESRARPGRPDTPSPQSGASWPEFTAGQQRARPSEPGPGGQRACLRARAASGAGSRGQACSRRRSEPGPHPASKQRPSPSPQVRWAALGFTRRLRGSPQVRRRGREASGAVSRGAWLARERSAWPETRAAWASTGRRGGRQGGRDGAAGKRRPAGAGPQGPRCPRSQGWLPPPGPGLPGGLALAWGRRGQGAHSQAGPGRKRVPGRPCPPLPSPS